MVTPTGISILVVEDDDDVRELLREVLAEQGFSVSTAAHGAEALVLLARGNVPSLIVLDLVMPIMDGHQFLKELHQANRTRHIPVLVTSATHEKPGAAQEFVAKPFSLSTLLQAIRRCVPWNAASAN